MMKNYDALSLSPSNERILNERILNITTAVGSTQGHA